MRKAVIAAALITSAVAGCASLSSQGTHNIAATHTAPPASHPAAPASTPARSEASYSRSCAYLLGDFTSHTAKGYRFVARAHIVNKGNIGIKVRIVARWVQVGSPDVVASTIERIPVNENATFSKTVEVSGDQIDAIQADTSLNDCSVKATIIGTFGPVVDENGA